VNVVIEALATDKLQILELDVFTLEALIVVVVIVDGKVDTFKVEQLITKADTVPETAMLQKLPVDT
jgi:hypothetical protein